MIREVADRGGVMGINLGPHFLDREFHRRSMPLFEAAQGPGVLEEERRRLREGAMLIPRPALEWVGRHVVHAMEVGGEDCVGLGGDLDGTLQLPDGIDTVADYPLLLPVLGAANLSERQIEKVCSSNFRRVFDEILP